MLFADCLVACFPCDGAFHTRGTFDTNAFALIKINGVVQDTRLRCGRYVNAATVAGVVDLQEARGRDRGFAQQPFLLPPRYRPDTDRRDYCDSRKQILLSTRFPFETSTMIPAPSLS